MDESGLHTACINGGYYREHAPKVLEEALGRYDVDGLFFNMFGNPSSDYHYRPIGLCHCDRCRERFQARFGRPLPDTADEDYRRFLFDCSQEVAARFAELIHARRPDAAFLTYIEDHVDGIMSESNTAVPPRLPLWPYSASDNVNRARNSRPDKMAFNLCMAFVDFRYRASAVPRAEIRLRLYQDMAHGAGPSFAMLGTFDQEDRTSLSAAKPVFRWHAEHEDLYVGQRSAARVLVLVSPPPRSNHGSDDYRGFFRLLSEQHIPFAVSDDPGILDREPGRFDLVIAPQAVDADLEGYLGRGGRLLIAGAGAATPEAARGRPGLVRDSCGVFPHPGSRPLPVPAGDGPPVRGRPLHGVRAAQAAAPYPDPAVPLRPPGEGLHRQGGDGQAGAAADRLRRGEAGVCALGRWCPLPPLQFRQPPGIPGGPDRSPAAGRSPVADGRPPAGRDHRDGAAGHEAGRSSIW